MPKIGSSIHGESRLRMLRIVRRGDRHDPKELTVSFRFEGDFAAAFREGRSEGLLPGETLKTLVHAIAREHGGGEIETFGLALCERVLAGNPAVTRARVEITEQQWTRLDAGGSCINSIAAVDARSAPTRSATSVNGRLSPSRPCCAR